MHYLNPSRKKAWVVFFFRNFAHNSWCSHTGMGISDLLTVQVLRRQRVRADLFGVWTPQDIILHLRQLGAGVTHVVIEAPWVSVSQMDRLMQDFPHAHFICRCHSQVGFLQVEAGAIHLIRQYLLLQESRLNFTFSGNSTVFCQYVEEVYNSRCLYLPNLYEHERPARKDCMLAGGFAHRVLRAGSFGALRLLKNHTTAAAAALAAARSRNCDLEFHVNVGREEHGKGVLQALRNMLSGLPWARLVEVPWKTWPEFRRVVAHMDLCFQLSFTETFNVVTADACAEGVPSVVSSAIDWLPSHWHADADDVADAARVANQLLWNPAAALEGLRHLRAYVRRGTREWLAFFDGERMGSGSGEDSSEEAQ